MHYNNGNKFPACLSGPQCGLVTVSKSHEEPYFPDDTKDIFRRENDIMFINNYVFEHFENPEAMIGYVADETLPISLTFVKHVAIHASCLSMEIGPEDYTWGKQLRFILCNFPDVETITMIATTVLDTSIPPSTCPLAYEILSIDAISLSDRARLGIVDDPKDVKLATASGMTADSVIQSWDNLGDHWPSWKRRKGATMKSEKKSAALPAPELCMMGVVFFAREWVDMEKDGEHGCSCKLVEKFLDPALRAAARTEIEIENLATKGGLMRRKPRDKAYDTRSLRSLGVSSKKGGQRQDVFPDGVIVSCKTAGVS